MLFAIPKETLNKETRVALTPLHTHKLIELGHKINIETSAGQSALFNDNEYIQAGANICPNFKDTCYNSDIILKIHAPQNEELTYLTKSQTIICDTRNILSFNELQKLANTGINLFGLNFIPRISRAQNMDILSSQNNLAGYEAVIIGSGHLFSIMPMLITSAGTIPPAKVLIMGLGVAGLQAAATSHRLGAQTFATDINPETEEQAKSLGIKFIKELTPEFINSLNMIITTVAPANQTPPYLLSKEQCSYISKHCVIIDLSSNQGGNINPQYLPKETIFISDKHLPRLIPHSASILFSENIFNFCNFIIKNQKIHLDLTDEIISQTLICRNKRIIKTNLSRTIIS